MNTDYSYKTNANPKINILMSEIIGQRKLNFSLEYFDALFYDHFQIKYRNIPEKNLVFFVRYFQT